MSIAADVSVCVNVCRLMSVMMNIILLGLLNVSNARCLFICLSVTIIVLVNRVLACMAGVKAGCVHLCWVAGNTM